MKKILNLILWEELGEGVWMLRPFFQKIYNIFRNKSVYDPDGLPF